MKTELTNHIITTVIHEIGYTKEQLLSNRRDILLHVARQYLIYFLNYYVGLENDQISQYLHKDRTTIIHGISAFERNIGNKKGYTDEFFRLDKKVRSITLNFIDYYGHDSNKWTFRSRSNILAGTDLSRVDRLLNKYWANQKRKRKLENAYRSNSRIRD